VDPAELAGAPDPRAGLTQRQAAERLQQEGPNELPRARRRSPGKITLDVFREPMFRLLIGAGLVYLMLGDRGEALLLLAFATATVLITIVQESRTERALEALRDLSSPRALVVRDAVARRIAGREVVREDLILLAEGDRVPADALLLAAADLQADESLLTGESVPVGKRAAAGSGLPDGDPALRVFAGSIIVRGHGSARVVATGARCELGRIGLMLAKVEEEPTPLTLQLQALVRRFAIIGIALSVGVFAGYGLIRGAWLQGLLAGIALAMSLLPEEFPLIVTVFLALGARRIGRHQVLTRRTATVEALGAATVLCTDKTGTLTANRMAVAELRPAAGSTQVAQGGPLTAGAAELAAWAVMASDRQPADPMEQALHALPHATDARAQLVREYGMTSELLAVVNVWRPGAGGPHQVAAKGAPEAIAELCRLAEPERAGLHRDLDLMAQHGLRVIAVGRALFDGPDLPPSPRAFRFEFLGLVGMADPLRPGVAAAIQECRDAGIRVMMVTGDYPETARAIAAQAGLDGAGRLLTGAEVDALDEAALRSSLRQAVVCARVMPRHKLRIVQALKADGEVVAMTGDGVNDAPCLRAAHIGVAMGLRGTDVAREAAALVLLDDDFGSIVSAVRLGRRIYDNMVKALGYTLAVHVPIAGLALFPLLLGWPMLIGPVHIVFLEMVIDPVCSIVFEAEREEADVMRRRPRPPAAPLFSRRLIAWSLLQGACMLALILGLGAAARWNGMADQDVRAVCFVSLVLTNVALILLNRSFGWSLWEAIRRPNRALWAVLAAVALLLTAVLAVPLLRGLFGFGLLHWGDIALSAAAAAVALAMLEAAKRRLWRPGVPA
jgi:Ca2+-transporting ATPase